MKYVYFLRRQLPGESVRSPDEGEDRTMRATNDSRLSPSKLARFSLKGVAWISPQLRTSNDHSFIVGVP